MKRLDLVGKIFGKIKVLGYLRNDKNGHSIWDCLCECGNKTEVIGDHLVRGNTESCGCRKGRFIHGMHKSCEYQAYQHAKSRCENPDTKHYENYGGRGIQFKFNSFEEFFEEIGPRPDGKSLDRIDNDGHYEIGNVRWSTRKEQQNNTRMSINKLMRTIAWG
jgi:hypothetical protein